MNSRLRKLANISKNKFLANNKCFTVSNAHIFLAKETSANRFYSTDRPNVKIKETYNVMEARTNLFQTFFF
jgi:hypothetical protein